MKSIERRPPGGRKIPDEVEDAIGWKVLIDSGEATDQDRGALEDWIRRSPANEAAWFDLSSSLSPFGSAKRVNLRNGTFAEMAMNRAIGRRKALLGILGLVATGSTGMFICNRYVPLDELTADRFTGTGERRTVALADGSEMTLGARTAVDYDIGVDKRQIALREGELYLRGHHANVLLVAEVGGLVLRADYGTFVLRRRNGRASITAVDRAAEVMSDGYQPVSLMPGQGVVKEGSRIIQRSADLKRETAWVEGLLVVDDQTLGYVAAALRPYFAGVIRVDPAVETVRVTGVFPLGDPSGALDLLAKTLNLSLSRTTPYWITIGPSGTAAI